MCEGLIVHAWSPLSSTHSLPAQAAIYIPYLSSIQALLIRLYIYHYSTAQKHTKVYHNDFRGHVNRPFAAACFYALLLMQIGVMADRKYLESAKRMAQGYIVYTRKKEYRSFIRPGLIGLRTKIIGVPTIGLPAVILLRFSMITTKRS